MTFITITKHKQPSPRKGATINTTNHETYTGTISYKHSIFYPVLFIFHFSTMSLEVTIYDDEDKPIEIMAYLIKGQSGMRDIYGLQETPDDEDEIEITSAITEDGEEITLTDAQEREAMEMLFDLRM